MDLYKVLGVRRDATGEEVKKAYRKIALQFHPDRHAQASKQQQEAAALRFREASEAYQVLIDPLKRAIYNRDGRHPNSASYGDRHAASSSSRPFHNQWHHQRYHSYGSPGRRHGPFRRFRISLSPLDIAFHAVFAGTIILGLLNGGAIGNFIWEDKNAGKSFEDVLRAKQQRDQERKEHDKKP